MRSQLQHAIKDDVGNPHGHCTEKGTLHCVIRYPKDWRRLQDEDRLDEDDAAGAGGDSEICEELA